MRDQFHEDLDTISDQLVELTRLAGSAISRATTALLDADVHLAESVIEADRKLDDIRVELDELSIDLLARQQPVATDLRIVVTAMHMSSDLERMGDLARHVAKVARLRTPDSAVPPELRAHILQMGQVAEAIVSKCGSIIASKDVAAAIALEKDDDQMDELHRQLFAALLDEDTSWPRSAILDLPVNADSRLQLSKYFIDPGASADDGSFPADHCSGRHSSRIDELCREISRAHIFSERCRDRCGNVV